MNNQRRRGPHRGGGGVAGEDRPRLPGQAVAVLLVHVFSQPVHVGAGQLERQLQVLLGELEGPDARVQPGPRGKSDSQHTALSARKLLLSRYSPREPLFLVFITHFHSTFEGPSNVWLIL